MRTVAALVAAGVLLDETGAVLAVFEILFKGEECELILIRTSGMRTECRAVPALIAISIDMKNLIRIIKQSCLSQIDSYICPVRTDINAFETEV